MSTHKKADAVQLIRDAEMRISHKTWDAMKDAKAMYGDCTRNYMTAVTLINDSPPAQTESESRLHISHILRILSALV